MAEAMYKPKAADAKKRSVEAVAKLLSEYPIVGIVNVEGLGAAQMQQLRERLRGTVLILMTKARLMKIAIETVKAKRPGIEALEAELKGMPALIFTKENPFKLANTLRQSKSPAPAKPGQIAPNDIIIQAGPTAFSPGPVIAELGSIGLKTGVEQGKVAVKEAKVVVKQGQAVPAKIADVLARLGITPMEIGLDLRVIYESGTIYRKDVLDVDPKKYIDNLSAAAGQAFTLAVGIGYPTRETITRLIGKAFTEAKSIALEREIINSETVKELIGKADKAASGLKAKVSAPEMNDEKPENNGQ